MNNEGQGVLANFENSHMHTYSHIYIGSESLSASSLLIKEIHDGAEYTSNRRSSEYVPATAVVDGPLEYANVEEEDWRREGSSSADCCAVSIAGLVFLWRRRWSSFSLILSTTAKIVNFRR